MREEHMPDTASSTITNSGNARADTLLGLTAEYVAGPVDPDRPTMRHFPAIALSMLPYVDLKNRARIAQMLAKRDSVPHGLALALAQDAIEVATPILRRDDLLGEGDLVSIIAEQTTPHALAICRRSSLPVTVVDALLTHGHPQIDRLLQQHHGATMTKDQADRLERRLGENANRGKRAETVHKTPRVATALPDRTLAKLFWSGRPCRARGGDDRGTAQAGSRGAFAGTAFRHARPGRSPKRCASSPKPAAPTT